MSIEAMPAHTGRSSPLEADDRRYSAGARWFHWVTAFLVFAVIPLGLIFGAFKTKPDKPDTFVAPFPGTPDDYASAHMTVGLILLALVLARIVYRVGHRPPSLPARVGRGERGLSHLTHWLLYTFLVVMPISGYIMMAGDKPPIVFLGLYHVPKLPITSQQGFAAAVVHVYSQFVIYALISLHLAGTAWHLFVRRDDILARMLPRQINADRP